MASSNSPTTNRISIGIAILGFLYSTAYCDKLNIFSAKVKSVPVQTTTTTTESSFSSLPSSSLSASKNSHYQNSFSVPESLLEKFKEHESTHLQNVSSSAHYYVYSGNPGRNTVKPKRKKNYKKNDVQQPLSDPSSLATYLASSSNTKARQSYGSSGGWGWPSSGSSNLDLYSLLGGLSFLGLLVSLFSYLANRNGTAVTIINGRRRRSIDGFGDVDELIGESLPEFLSKLGLGLDSPWWWGSKDDGVDKKNVTPFKLE